MATDINEARKKLDDEFGQVRRHLDRIQKAFDDVTRAGPEDDISQLLEKLEDVVKEVRTGGLIGSGAHGHRRALEKYNELRRT